jgi:hypothetical protein
MLIYEDAAWVLLTDAEYAELLLELQTLMVQLETLVTKWQQDLQTYYNALKAAANSKRRRNPTLLSQQAETVNTDRKNILDFFTPQPISKCALRKCFALQSCFFPPT